MSDKATFLTSSLEDLARSIGGQLQIDLGFRGELIEIERYQVWGQENYTCTMCSPLIFLFLHLTLGQVPSDTISTSTVYHPHLFDKNEYCRTLRCSTDELCVVTEKTARCVKNDKLHEIDGVHIDFASGKPIEHQVEESNPYSPGRIKPQHKHEHLLRHYEHPGTPNHSIY
uniref:Uncharacterized protein n=1 Tax=Setaria digitata TaxID=48799 RepID=A0A915PXH1_9BILA